MVLRRRGDDDMGEKGRTPTHPDVLVSHLQGESVLLDMESKNYFRLNATASAIWRGIEAGKDRAEIVAELQATFDASPDAVAEGFDDTIRQLETRKLVVIAEDSAVAPKPPTG